MSTVHNPSVSQPDGPAIQTAATNSWIRLVATLVVVAIGGVLCIVAPVWNLPRMPAPLFPLLRTGVEKLDVVPIALMAGMGLVAGVATRAPVWAIAISSVALLPCAAIAEIVADGTSHNLIPFEIIMYGFMGLPVLAMAAAGRGLKRLVSKR